MSFVLPGNSRQLRFTGEAKAQTAKADRHAGSAGHAGQAGHAGHAGTGALALGKPRVRRPPPPPPTERVMTPAPAAAVATRVSTPAPGRRPRTPGRARAPYGNEPVPSPVPSPYDGAVNPPVLGYPQGDVDDDHPTMAMDRDGRDVLPGARALRTPKPSPAISPPPIPHFRPAHLAQPPPSAVALPGTTSNTTRSVIAAAPLAIWIFAGILAGIISYHVAPEIVMRAEPAHAARQR